MELKPVHRLIKEAFDSYWRLNQEGVNSQNGEDMRYLAKEYFDAGAMWFISLDPEDKVKIISEIHGSPED